MTFLEDTEREERFQFKLRTVGDNVEDIKYEFKMMRAFIAKKFPGEDYRNVMEAVEMNEVDLHERDDDTNIQHESNTDIQESPHLCTFHQILFRNCFMGSVLE